MAPAGGAREDGWQEIDKKRIFSRVLVVERAAIRHAWGSDIDIH